MAINNLIPISILLTIILFASCDNKEEEKLTDEELLIKKVKNQHGSDKILNQDIEFTFRNHRYKRVIEDDQVVKYRIEEKETGEIIVDKWKDDNLIRTVDSKPLELTDSIQKVYINSINSVFYFTFLPLNLTDPAVNAKIIDTVSIKKEPYIQVRITFDEQGGGEDFEDVYMYWFHKENFTLDYLAYQYFTNEGGIRFREVIDRQEIGGITFQNFINYKPQNDESNIENIHLKYEEGNLIEVSLIENKDVKVFN